MKIITKKSNRYPASFLIRLLTLSVIAILLIAATFATRKPIIWVCGDSTATNVPASGYPLMGWAQMLQSFFDSNKATVDNRASSGRSSRSFFSQKWPDFKDKIQVGDYVVIQFGHNDPKTDNDRFTTPGEGGTFEKYLMEYIKHAGSVGAIPILVTPIERNRFSGNTVPTTHGKYPETMRNLAKKENVVLVDLTQLSNELFVSLGEKVTTATIFNKGDGTHLQETGAIAISRLFTEDLARQKVMPIVSWLKNPPEIKLFSLKTSVAEGNGTVAPEAVSIDSGKSVSITATAASGYGFDHWSGDFSGTTNPATVTLTKNITISAHFKNVSLKNYTITIKTPIGGTITQTPQDSSLPEGTKVTCTASALNGWKFIGWNGDLAGNDNSFTIASLSKNISVEASFMPNDLYVYEAENGIMNDVSPENTNKGFSGDSYVIYNPFKGASLGIPVYSAEGGNKIIAISYVSEGRNEALSVSVNGIEQIAALGFDGTIDYNSWTDKMISLTLPKGISIITFTLINDVDPPNIDKITIKTDASMRHGRVRNNPGATYYYPARNVLYIHRENANNLAVSVVSLDGTTMLSQKFNMTFKGEFLEIPLSGLGNGMYLVKSEFGGNTKVYVINVSR